VLPAARVGEQMTVAFTADPGLINERELRAQMKEWRHGRATRNVRQALSDGYIVVLGGLMIGAMIVNVVLQAQRVASACAVGACLAARLVVPWAVFAGILTGALVMGRLFGPVLASAAEGSWLLDAPVRRSRLLWTRFVGVMVGAFLVGGLLGAGVAALTGSSWQAIAAWAGASALGGAGTVAFAGAEQGANRTIWTRVFSSVFGWLALLALLLVVSISAGWISFDLPTAVRLDIALLLGAAALLGLAVCAVLGLLRLNNIRRARLLSGGSLVAGLSGAFFALDLGLAHDIVVERKAMEIGHVRAYRGRGTGPAALVWRELQRTLRFPAPLFGIAATIVVPYACEALGIGGVAPFISALTLFVSLIGIMGGLRVLTRTGGFARCLPFSVARMRVSLITIPAIVCGVWALATLPAYLVFGQASGGTAPYDSFLTSVAVAGAGLIGAMRWTVAKPIDFGVPMVSTQAGAFPPGLMLNLFRGIDMCLLITAPLLLHWPPLVALAIGAIAMGFLLMGGLDAEALKARQEEQQKQLAQTRAGSGKR